jgi:hypothetical protein
MPYIFTYGVSFKPLFIGFYSLSSFVFGWIELFGGRENVDCVLISCDTV